MNAKRSLFCLLALFCFSSVARGQVITTVVGSGTAGYGGDGGPATAADFHMACIAFDTSGNMYIADEVNHRVRIVNIDGIVSTIAGTGVPGFSGDGSPATIAQVNNVNSIAADHSGNVYFGDGFNYRIRKINSSGIITTVAGIGTMGYTGDGLPATAAQINNTGVRIADATGNIYIGCNGAYRKVDPSGIITTFAGTGILGYSGDGGPATAAQLRNSNGIASDGMGNFYISDMVNNRVRKIDAAGIITTFAGTGTAGFLGDGGPATAARFNYPCDIAIDAAGNIYVADINNKRIRKIDASGIITTIAGTGTAGFSGDGGPASVAQLDGAGNIAIDGTGNLFIRDYGNNRVRMVALQHTPFFTAGLTDSLTVCANSAAAPVNAMLAVADSDAGQTLRWHVTMAATHGTVTGSYAATSTGSMITPTGLSYTPTPGYVGNDSFTIRISDGGFATSRITIYVIVEDCSLETVLNPGSAPMVNGLSVWPNPGNGAFTFRLSSATRDEVQVCITDITGRKIKDFGTFTNTRTPFNLHVAAGIYFMNAVTSQGTWSSKIVVAK